MLIHVPKGADNDLQHALYLIRQVPGVSTFASARWTCNSDFKSADRSIDWHLLEKEIVALASRYYVNDASFAIRINRTDKKLPVTSQQIGVRPEETIRQRTE